MCCVWLGRPLAQFDKVTPGNLSHARRSCHPRPGDENKDKTSLKRCHNNSKCLNHMMLMSLAFATALQTNVGVKEEVESRVYVFIRQLIPLSQLSVVIKAF